MYELLWRVLPGPGVVKVVLFLALVSGVVAVLFQWVFPALAPYLPFNEQTVEQTP